MWSALAAAQAPVDGGSDAERLLIEAAKRASPRFAAAVKKQTQYRPMGIFFSEALALVGAIELVGATHLIESGTASGQSTELLARYFKRRLQITTIDRDTLYGLYEQTKKRLSAYKSITLIKGDSFVEIPRLLNALPNGSRAVVFVDGPKGHMGFQLAKACLRHKRVPLVALHDTARVWDRSLHDELIRHKEFLMETSLPRFRSRFSAMDASHGELDIISEEYRKNPLWSKDKIPRLMAHGHGIWFAGKSKLTGNSDSGRRGHLFDEQVFVAMGADRMQLPALVACLTSLLASTLRPSVFTIVVFVGAAKSASAVSKAIECLRASGALRGAQVRCVHLFEQFDRFPLLMNATDYRVTGARAKIPHESSVINLARFYLPDLLPEASRVLWLDVDGIVRGDVRTLLSSVFAFPRGDPNALVAALVPGKSIMAQADLNATQLRTLGLHTNVHPSDLIFNAGFMALNLAQWRKHGITVQLETLMGKMTEMGYRGLPGRSTLRDSQTPMVLVMRSIKGAIVPLRPLWNVEGLAWRRSLPRASLCEAHFLHWNGPPHKKPWLYGGLGKLSSLWRHLKGREGLYDPEELCEGSNLRWSGNAKLWPAASSPRHDYYASLWRAHAAKAGSCLGI